MSNIKPIDTQKAAQKNPAVNLKRLQEAQELQEKLRTQGYRAPGYGLQSPLERKLKPLISHTTQK